MKHRLSYASVTATLALMLAVGGTTAVGAQALLTGRNVKDESLTGADVQNDSLTGADIRAGSLGSNVLSSVARANLRGQTGPAGPKGDPGATGAQGPAGVGITVTTASGPDVANYVNRDVLATTTLSTTGDYVIFGHVTAHNTSLNDDWINCGLFIGSAGVGGGGGQVLAGDTQSFSVVGAMSVSGSTDVTLQCEGGGNGGTFDLSNLTMRTHNLG